jgi:hypothetical protein
MRINSIGNAIQDSSGVVGEGLIMGLASEVELGLVLEDGDVVGVIGELVGMSVGMGAGVISEG